MYGGGRGGGGGYTGGQGAYGSAGAGTDAGTDAGYTRGQQAPSPYGYAHGGQVPYGGGSVGGADGGYTSSARPGAPYGIVDAGYRSETGAASGYAAGRVTADGGYSSSRAGLGGGQMHSGMDQGYSSGPQHSAADRGYSSNRGYTSIEQGYSSSAPSAPGGHFLVLLFHCVKFCLLQRIVVLWCNSFFPLSFAVCTGSEQNLFVLNQDHLRTTSCLILKFHITAWVTETLSLVSDLYTAHRARRLDLQTIPAACSMATRFAECVVWCRAPRSAAFSQ